MYGDEGLPDFSENQDGEDITDPQTEEDFRVQVAELKEGLVKKLTAQLGNLQDTSIRTGGEKFTRYLRDDLSALGYQPKFIQKMLVGMPIAIVGAPISEDDEFLKKMSLIYAESILAMDTRIQLLYPRSEGYEPEDALVCWAHTRLALQLVVA